MLKGYAGHGGGGHGGGGRGGRGGRHHGGRHRGGWGWGYGYPYYGYPYYDDLYYQTDVTSEPQIIMIDQPGESSTGNKLGINWPTIAISVMLSALMLMRR